MTDYEKKRQSHCITCGKRLSEKSDGGDIVWHISHVDDKGIYCENCYAIKMHAKKSKSKGK
ncbi:MAG: hypothetical protein M0042_09075 [Nitrospiraceae bacterium]|nr:hypothetical protein [Nitrospiraceae bacterium]